MSDEITDTNNQPILYINLSLVENADSSVIVARIPCKAGMFITTNNDARATVFARRTGSLDAFVNIATSPYDLSPFAGSTVEFDFKVRAGSVTGLERVALSVRVTFNP